MAADDRDRDYWATERLRLLLVLIVAALGGVASGYWLISLCVSLALYMGWVLFKLRQLNIWLRHGAKLRELPESNGIWERIVQHIQALQLGNTRQKKRLAKTLKRFRGIITGLPYATVVLNRNNEIDWANRTARDYLGIQIKHDRGQRIENLLRLPSLHTLLENNRKDELETTLPGGDGRELAIQLIPVQKDLKLLIARDISERVRTQKMRRAFIANASHELRTPLTVVSGYLEMIQGDPQLPEHLKPMVATAAGQAQQMQNIIGDLLMLSRLENFDLNPDELQEVNVPAIVKSVCHDHAGLHSSEAQTIICDIDDSLTLKGEESEIFSVCNNLVSNAIRHTAPGTPIHVSWEKDANGHACLRVSDQGEGIPAEHIPRLTERFYRVDKGRSRDMGGTGLGLAIVQHILQRHGGELHIQSTVGEGSTFSACFPDQQ